MAVEIQVKVNVNDNGALQKITALNDAAEKLRSADININVNATGLENLDKNSIKGINALSRIVSAQAKYDVAQSRSTTATAKLTAAHARITRERRLATQQTEKYNKTEEKAAKTTEKVAQSMSEASKNQGYFESVLGTSLGKYILRLGTYQAVSGTIYGMVSAFKDALKTMKEVDSELASIKKVTDFSDEQMEVIEKGAYSVASQYGVSAQEYLESVTAFAKAGYRDLADDLGELAIKTQLVGDVNASTANKFLLAVDAAWKMGGSVEDLSRVLDEANVVENNYATSIDKLAQGMPNVASVASMAGMTAEQTIAALGTITAVTQQSGTKAATALRALILNIMKDTTTEVEEGVTVTKEQVETLDEVIQKYAGSAIEAAQATGEIVNPMTVVAALAKAYQENAITDRDLAKIEMALGGKLRTNQLDALLKNFYGANGEEGMYEGMLNKITEAAGSADKEIGIMLDTWEAKSNILKNTWTEFVAKTISTDIFKGILDGATKALKIVGDLGTAITGLGGILAGKFFINLPKTLDRITSSFEKIGGWSGLGKNALIMGVTSAISAAIIIYQKYRKSIIDAMNASMEEAQKTSESSEKLFDLVNAYERAEEGSQAMKDASAQLASALGLEGDAVDSLKEKYQELTEAKLREATGSAAEAMANASKAIETEFQFNSDQLTVSRGGGNIADIIQRNLKDFYDEYSGYYHAGQTIESKMAFARASQEALAEVKAFAGGLKDEVERNKIFDSTQYKDLVNINNALSEYISNYDAAGKLLERSRINEDIFEAKDNGHIETQEDYERYRDSLKATIEDTETLNAVLGTLEKTFPQFSGYVAEGTDALADEEKQLDATTNAIERYKNAKATDKDGNKKKGEKDDNFKTVAGAFGTMRDEAKKGRYQSNEFQDAAALVLGQNYMSTHTTKEAKKHIDELQKMGVFNPDSAGTGLYNLIRNNKDVEKTADGYYAVADGLAAVKKNADGTFDFKITDKPEELEQVANALEVSATSLISMQQAMGVFDGSIDVSALDDLLNKVDTLKQKSEEETNIEYTTNADEVTTAVQTLAAEAPKAAGSWDLEYNIVVNGEIPSGGVSGGGSGGRGANGDQSTPHSASGDSSFKGGLTWVNDEKGGFNPELIETGGKSFFVNGGRPALVSLPKGSIIHNATDTRKLFAQDFTEVPHYASGSNIPLGSIADRSGRIAGIGSGKSSASSKDWWEKLQEYMEELLEKAGDALDKQLEAIDAELFYLQYGKEVSEKATKLEEARMDLLEAEQELINAQTERTVRYFNAETGQWEWMADQRDIIKAQEELAERQKDYLKAQYDYLEDVWNELKDDIQKAIDGKKDVNIAKVLKQMLKSKAGGLTGNVEGLIGDLLNLITAFSNGSALDTYDSGGIASGLGYMYKATKADEVVLNGGLSSAILSPKRSQQFADFTSSLERMFGMSSMVERPRSMAGVSTSDNHSTNVYMNGIKIGSDMLNKPLSEVLSVLPIYCN